MPKKQVMIPVAAAFMAATTVFAAPALADMRSPPVPTEIAAEQSAANVIQTLADQAIEELTSPDTPDDVRRERFVSLMDEYFEMNVVARFVLGRYWRTISEQEITEFADLLENYLALNYANQFKEFDGGEFVVGDETTNKNDTFVDSQFVRTDGPPVNINWRMREFDGAYKIIDVSIEGLSMGITQRDEFTSVIQKNGGDVSALTDALKKKAGL